MRTPTDITLCMGSSCSSRGNGKNLPRIQEFLKDHGLAAQVTLKGCRCGGGGAAGPCGFKDPARAAARLNALP